MIVSQLTNVAQQTFEPLEVHVLLHYTIPGCLADVLTYTYHIHHTMISL